MALFVPMKAEPENTCTSLKRYRFAFLQCERIFNLQKRMHRFFSRFSNTFVRVFLF